MNPREIAKAGVAGLTALGTWGATAMADGHVDGVEAFGLCGVAVVVLSVWATPNEPADDGWPAGLPEADDIPTTGSPDADG